MTLCAEILILVAALQSDRVASSAAEPAEIQCLSQGHLTRTEFRLKLLLSSLSSHLSICLSDFFLKWKKGAGNHFGAMKLFACTKDTTV